MEAYADSSPLWDLSQASSFSQLPDDDFLALLQKQFPSSNTNPYAVDFGMGNGVNPQTISRYSLPSLTPPSEDSSPSPPQQSGSKSPEDEHDLKRKASDDSLDEEPSQKTQHTLSNGKKGGSAKRKSSGTTNPDETRLMKRKEQNRAAQRAFRERKEKHVKDLEDKVAALEAKNDQANSENENLRDLLSRLQNENVMLKESSFTFSVPKAAASSSTPSLASVRSPSASLPASSPPVPSSVNPLDWSSLTTFDPTMLNLLDDTPQQTATDGVMRMDFGFGGENSFSQPPRKPQQFTTIASNPMFTSFPSAFDSYPPPRPAEQQQQQQQQQSTPSAFNFDINSLSAWSTPNPDNGAFDDLFGGFMGGSTVDFNDFNVLMSHSPGASSISPVAHHASLNNMAGRSPANSITSSASSKSSDPLFNTPRDSGSDSDMEVADKECPKTKAQLKSVISSSGTSVFAATEVPTVRKATDSIFGPQVMCEGSAFPQTAQSEKNMEILTAWRTVTSDPKFKDSDLADLCQEFSNKARCDGTKVVLEPQGVRNIIESLGQKHNNRK
ncbi:hypothetical protein C8F04DRAFT_412038 [Mycena alexandri]|uniref:BZIP domain-containing protein n=1 Tax=Mycena alexandri TaxID=1745969 RepID=A0AAD6T150_9AGAR|nr:hypothetical protein C8F04DRAFT_412038 [Mycena alexandri]